LPTASRPYYTKPGCRARENIHIGMRQKGLYRKDAPEISVDALHEAVINAFCHRDYRDHDYVIDKGAEFFWVRSPLRGYLTPIFCWEASVVPQYYLENTELFCLAVVRGVQFASFSLRCFGLERL
jgi:hypothetical protein